MEAWNAVAAFYCEDQQLIGAVLKTSIDGTQKITVLTTPISTLWKYCS